jgi:NADPH:quinone reductase-like Zn-dependent oxidoreductase
MSFDIPSSMRAMRLHANSGGPASLQLDENVPVPVPSEDEVLIAVKACGLNQVDLLTRDGETPREVPLPHISGTEVAGDIVSLGNRVNNWKVGDRVVVDPILTCGECESCITGRTNMCRVSRVFGVQTNGGYAEYTIAPARQLLSLSDNLNYAEAAAVAVTGPTAWHMLRHRADIRIGETVLIIAAGSGIGVMGIQIAKMAGARVITTVGSEGKVNAATALGADLVVNHSEDGWANKVREFTGGRGVDVVFEHVGAATWTESLKALGRGGRLVTCGGHSGFDVNINLWHLFVKEQILIGSFAGSRQDFLEIMALTAHGHVRQVVQEILPFADLSRAQQMLRDRKVFGKLILDPTLK